MPKWFPIQSSNQAVFHIPWRIGERAWRKYAELGHGDQSCERIAERGGFGLSELVYLLADENPWAASSEELEALQGKLVKTDD